MNIKRIDLDKLVSGELYTRVTVEIQGRSVTLEIDSEGAKALADLALDLADQTLFRLRDAA